MRAPVVTITARTGDAPELRFLDDGTAVCKVRAVWSQDRPDGNGGWTATGTTWATVEWWGRAAEHTGDLRIGKGDLIRVTGALTTDTYTRRDGTEGSTLKLRADGTPRVWPRRDGDGAAPGGDGRAARLNDPAPRDTPAPAASSGGFTTGGGDGYGDPPF